MSWFVISLNKLIDTQICSHLKQSSVAACLSHSILLAGVAGMQMCLARTYLQLPLRQWGAGNVYLLVFSS